MVDRLYHSLIRTPDESYLSSASSVSTSTAAALPQQQHEETTASAAAFARQAPAAGYLLKLGQNVTTMKRRFFVVMPATHLYYFFSPHDTTPRGCFDLQDSWIESSSSSLVEGGGENNEKNSWSICWKDGRRVVLEARSAESATEWKQALETQRLPFAQAALAKAERQTAACQQRIADLQAQVKNYRLMEQDRDGALEDARQWKARFEELDQAVRQMTQQLRRTTTTTGHDGNAQEGVLNDETKLQDDVLEEEKKEEGIIDNEAKDEDVAEGESTRESSAEYRESNQDNDLPLANEHDKVPDSFAPPVSRETSLLDEEVVPKEGDTSQQLDPMTVPGQYFHGLYHACEQVTENYHLAATEAATAVQDLVAANERVVAVESRMAKAEQHLCKLWEENCTLRKTLKQKKREKRVLVREVKNLLEQTAQAARDELSVDGRGSSDGGRFNDNDHGGSDGEEEKLLNELEEHVMSSIRLHEEFLSAGSPGLKNAPAVRHGAVAASTTGKSTPQARTEPAKENAETSLRRPPTLRQSASTRTEQVLTRAPRSLLSLFDESDDDSSLDDENGSTAAVSLSSSVVAEASDSERETSTPLLENIPPMISPSGSTECSSKRPNPVDQLDDDEQPQLCTVSSQSDSSKSVVVTKNGQATTKLACPLVDVVSTRGDDVPRGSNELRVYHLTFYSRKIGLQFQKIPPPPAKANGLLTEAMTADLIGVEEGGEKTAAELRRIAAFSSRAKSGDLVGDTCEVATPVDAVLVCGFNGFDDSGSNTRPKLGARLVAFDGVSVEIGKWTFESIRKAIQARSRPLTLSFRNDFLTTEQRRILTRAAQEVKNAAPQRNTQHLPSVRRRPSMDPSVQSALSAETDNVHSDASTNCYSQENEQSSDYRYSVMPQSFSATRSVASSGNGNRYSFSEAGSSASVLSAVAPLVTNLLKRRNEPFTPEYLRRDPESVENTPQHQDFKSELL